MLGRPAATCTSSCSHLEPLRSLQCADRLVSEQFDAWLVLLAMLPADDIVTLSIATTEWHASIRKAWPFFCRELLPPLSGATPDTLWTCVALPRGHRVPSLLHLCTDMERRWPTLFERPCAEAVTRSCRVRLPADATLFATIVPHGVGSDESLVEIGIGTESLSDVCDSDFDWSRLQGVDPSLCLRIGLFAGCDGCGEGVDLMFFLCCDWKSKLAGRVLCINLPEHSSVPLDVLWTTLDFTAWLRGMWSEYAVICDDFEDERCDWDEAWSIIMRVGFTCEYMCNRLAGWSNEDEVFEPLAGEDTANTVDVRRDLAHTHNWTQQWSAELGRYFYHNRSTGLSQWAPPDQ